MSGRRARGNGDDRDFAQPHSVEAEQAVLGSLLVDAAAFPRIDRMIGDIDFYRPDHRAIFTAIRALAEDSQPHDVVTVQDKLTRCGKLEESGGFAYLGKLARDTSTPINIAFYAEVLQERSSRREALRIAHELATHAQVVTDRSLIEAIAQAQQQLADLAAPITPEIVSPLAAVRSVTAITTGVLTPVKYLTRERIPCGIVLLVARPKMKKSWLALQACKAAAEGGEMLGQSTREGRALGLFLEDNDRRMAQRLAFLGAERMSAEARDRLHVCYTWPKGVAGVAALQEWMTQHPDTILIVIDVLQKFRSEHDPRSNAYAADYAALEALQGLARQHPDLCILILHHTRKGRGDSPGESVSGTFGITGAADAYVILEAGPEPNTAKAHIDGRDWELWTHDFVWRFEDGIGWTHVQAITESDSLTQTQREWLELVRSKGRVTPTEAAIERSVSKSAACQMLAGLEKRGHLGSDRGAYFIVS